MDYFAENIGKRIRLIGTKQGDFMNKKIGFGLVLILSFGLLLGWQWQTVFAQSVCNEVFVDKDSPLSEFKTIKPLCLTVKDFVVKVYKDRNSELYTYKDGEVSFQSVLVDEVILRDADMIGTVSVQKADSDGWTDFTVDSTLETYCGDGSPLARLLIGYQIKALKISSNHLDRRNGECVPSGRPDSAHIFLVQKEIPATPTPSPTVVMTPTSTAIPATPPVVLPTPTPMLGQGCTGYDLKQEAGTIVVNWSIVVTGPAEWELSEDGLPIDGGFISAGKFGYEHEVKLSVSYTVKVTFEGKEPEICLDYSIAPTGEIEQPEPLRQIFLPLISRP